MKRNFEWKRYPANPIIRATPGTFFEDQSANPDLLIREHEYLLYFRGQQGGHDRIGLARADKNNFDGALWEILSEPVIDVGMAGDPDESHALDPAAIEVNGKIFLYYSAVSPTCERSICLAISRDGIHFEKCSKNPILIGGCPEVVCFENKFHLFYWHPRENHTGFEIHSAVSDDGINFSPLIENPVLPVGNENRWDSHTVETPRIFFENGIFHMIYCGSDRNDDYPDQAGLAISKDLIHWEKFSGNPIFSRGKSGDWDEGAIWFTTVEKIRGKYFLWYEGYGGGVNRDVPYDSYLRGGKSQIGLAILEAPYFYVPGRDF